MIKKILKKLRWNNSKIDSIRIYGRNGFDVNYNNGYGLEIGCDIKDYSEINIYLKDEKIEFQDEEDNVVKIIDLNTMKF